MDLKYNSLVRAFSAPVCEFCPRFRIIFLMVTKHNQNPETNGQETWCINIGTGFSKLLTELWWQPEVVPSHLPITITKRFILRNDITNNEKGTGFLNTIRAKWRPRTLSANQPKGALISACKFFRYLNLTRSQIWVPSREIGGAAKVNFENDWNGGLQRTFFSRGFRGWYTTWPWYQHVRYTAACQWYGSESIT